MEELLRHFGIDYKNRNGWLQVNCPNCHDSNHHGALREGVRVFTCFKCGKLSFRRILSELLNVDARQLETVIRPFNIFSETHTEYERITRRDIKVIYPFEHSLLPIHSNYLTERKFDPERLVRLFKLSGTNHLQGNYSFRIVIPIIFGGELVSWTTRSLDKNAELRYLSCPLEEERIAHKSIVYNFDTVDDVVLITEGPFDTMRFGDGCVATFGIDFTEEQVELLGSVKKRFILFDPSPSAQLAAERLASMLATYKGSTEIIIPDWEEDLADLNDGVIKEIKNYIF